MTTTPPWDGGRATPPKRKSVGHSSISAKSMMESTGLSFAPPWPRLRFSPSFLCRTSSGLDSDARMNVPSKPGGNWSWRLRKGSLTQELANKMAALTEVTDRDVCVKTPVSSSDPSGTAMGAEFAA